MAAHGDGRRQTVAAVMERMRLGDLLGVLDDIAARTQARLDLYDAAIGEVPLDRQPAPDLDRWETLCVRRLRVQDSVDALFALLQARMQRLGSSALAPFDLRSATLRLLEETARLDATDGFFMRNIGVAEPSHAKRQPVAHAGNRG